MNPTRTLLFAHPRTGSSSLNLALNAHPRLNLAEDPFWHGYGAYHPGEKNYVDEVKDVPSLERALEELFARYNGLKVLDYQLDEKIFDHLLRKPEFKVIFLQRRNLLRAEVSCHIAEQTKVWNMMDMNEERQRIYRNLAPIPPDALASSLEYAADLVRHYTKTLRSRPAGTYIEVFYEDLYAGDLKANRAAVCRIFDFLGLDMPQSEVIDHHLDPSRSRINSQSTYQLVPNARQLNEKFGNERTGWLFPPE